MVFIKWSIVLSKCPPNSPWIDEWFMKIASARKTDHVKIKMNCLVFNESWWLKGPFDEHIKLYWIEFVSCFLSSGKFVFVFSLKALKPNRLSERIKDDKVLPVLGAFGRSKVLLWPAVASFFYILHRRHVTVSGSVCSSSTKKKKKVFLCKNEDEETE